MARLRRRREQPTTSDAHRTGTVAFTARRLPQTVAARPQEDAERSTDALSAQPPPDPDARIKTPVRIHEERLDDPASRPGYTPSQAMHLVREGPDRDR